MVPYIICCEGDQARAPEVRAKLTLYELEAIYDTDGCIAVKEKR